MEQPAFPHTARDWLARARRLWQEGLAAPAEAVDSDFLPDFCSGWIIFNVVVVAELLAIVINLFMPSNLLTANVWLDLLVVSVFVQWVAVGGTAVLCRLRAYLNRLPGVRAGLMAYFVLLAVTFVVGELALLLLWATGKVGTLRPAWYGDFQVFSLTVSAIAHGLLLRYFVAKHELTQRTRSEARARLQALQSRIRPHFVFNSLNIIASLTRNEPAKAEAAIEDMADLFRMMLSEDETLVPVRNEVEVAKKYLALETLRLDQRLTVNWDIGTFPRTAVIPVLTLQPLLEHAIRRGIEELPGGGVLDVRLWEEADTIHIRVDAPLAKAKGRRSETAPDRTIENMRLRFQNHYGDAARLETGDQEGRLLLRVALPTRGGKP